eukprot:13166364-Alexandrium_andersonii.AAC.1
MPNWCCPECCRQIAAGRFLTPPPLARTQLGVAAGRSRFRCPSLLPLAAGEAWCADSWAGG